MDTPQRVPLISQARHTFEGRQLKAGDPFTALPGDADDLLALHMATRAPAGDYQTSALTAEKPAAPAKGRYKRRDLRARN